MERVFKGILTSKVDLVPMCCKTQITLAAQGSTLDTVRVKLFFISAL